MHRLFCPLFVALIVSGWSLQAGAKEQECYGESWTPDSRYELKDDVAYDNKTKLYWRRCAEGSKWTGTSCSGEPRSYLMREYLTEFKISGSDWRLPTIDELNSIKSGQRASAENIGSSPSGCIKPAINLNIFPDETSKEYTFYGTSSMTTGYELSVDPILNGDLSYTTKIRCLNMANGDVCSAYSNPAKDKFRIRLVRGKEYVGDYIKKKLAYTISSRSVSKIVSARPTHLKTSGQRFECRVKCEYGGGVTADNIFTDYSVNASDRHEAKQKTKNDNLDKICERGGYYQAAPSASFSMECMPK